MTSDGERRTALPATALSVLAAAVATLATLFGRIPRWVREAALVAVIYTSYEAGRGLHSSPVALATRNGWALLHWERAWHLAPERLLTGGLIHVTPLAVAFAYFYSTMHYVITPVVLVWMYRCHAGQYRSARTALAVSTVSGLLIFYLVPTAPPRLLRGAGVPDALFDVRHWGWWGGEGSVPRGLGGITNQFAAMPSLHVGWALWCGFLIARHARRSWVRALGVAYPIATTVVVLSTGNHYLLDALAGALVMGLGPVVVIASGRAGHRIGAYRADRFRHRTCPATPSFARRAASGVPIPGDYPAIERTQPATAVSVTAVSATAVSVTAVSATPSWDESFAAMHPHVGVGCPRQ